MPKKAAHMSLKDAVLAQITPEPTPVSDVVAAALKAHPSKAGKTPKASAAARITALIQEGKVVRTERRMVALAPEQAPTAARKTRSSRRAPAQSAA